LPDGLRYWFRRLSLHGIGGVIASADGLLNSTMSSSLKAHAVKAVFFDAVGTLLIPHPPAAEVYADCGRQFGADLDISTVRQRFRQAMVKPWGPKTSEDLERQRWRDVVTNVYRELPDAGGALFEALWEHFTEPQSWRLAEGVADLWIRLQQLGIQLGIASNFDDRLKHVCAGWPPLDHCSLIFCSAQLGYAKPHVTFFRTIQQQIGIPPHELLMVGDDWEKDYRGATQCGWQAVWVSSKRAPKLSGNADSVVRIFKLAELGPLLANRDESDSRQL